MNKFWQHLKEQNYECSVSDGFVVDVIGILSQSGSKSKLENEFEKVSITLNICIVEVISI